RVGLISARALSNRQSPACPCKVPFPAADLAGAVVAMGAAIANVNARNFDSGARLYFSSIGASRRRRMISRRFVVIRRRAWSEIVIAPVRGHYISPRRQTVDAVNASIIGKARARRVSAAGRRAFGVADSDGGDRHGYHRLAVGVRHAA